MKAEEVANVLAEFNTWRRGLPPYEWNDDPSNQKELQYSAKELGIAIDAAVDMLKHAYGMEREKKYEYAVKESGSHILPVHSDCANTFDGLARGDDHCVIVRRSVGEWEEVE